MLKRIEGLEIEIYPESMRKEQPYTWRQGGCGGSWWQITPDSGRLIQKTIGAGGAPNALCEHMLEMD